MEGASEFARGAAEANGRFAHQVHYAEFPIVRPGVSGEIARSPYPA
jgi:hypothetical protein